MWKFLLINNSMGEIDKLMKVSQDYLYCTSNIREDELPQDPCVPWKGVHGSSSTVPGGWFLKLREILLRPRAAPAGRNPLDSFIVSGLGCKGRKLLEAYRRRPAPTGKELRERRERSARGPSLMSIFHLRRIESCLKATFILDKIRSVQGWVLLILYRPFLFTARAFRLKFPIFSYVR